MERPFSIAEWQAVSPAWDVAVPTYAERGQPQPLASPKKRPSSVPPNEYALLVRDIREIDDRLFFRAQRLVRQALLRRADELCCGEDIFFCNSPLGTADNASQIAKEAAHNRSELTAAATWHMPLRVRGGRPVLEPVHLGDHFRGDGVGTGTAAGLVSRIDAENPQPKPGTIVVVAAVTPNAIEAFESVLGLVSEFDGLLGHTAALARELDIPCVVRCSGAWRHLRSGDAVLLDGLHGLVLRAPC